MSRNVKGIRCSRRLAGVSVARAAIEQLIGWPILHGLEGEGLGVQWPRGLLLHGPSGCGKTTLVYDVAESFGVVVQKITASEIYGAYTGESERCLRESFDKAQAAANAGQPTVLFIDDLDTLAPRRDVGRPHEARVVAQLLTLLDGAASNLSGAQSHLWFIGATNDVNAIDTALRRLGRLDHEVAITLPDAQERLEILRFHSEALPLDRSDVDLKELALKCNGCSGADLAALCRAATLHAISTAFAPQPGLGSQGTCAMDHLRVKRSDFKSALCKVCPTSARGTQVMIDEVSWADIGGYTEIKKRLQQALEWPIRHADAYKRLGLQAPHGVLLHGPPGCSKTTLARAAARASGMQVQVLSGAQLFSMYVGEGEALLRAAFQRARMTAPSIIFIDEIDAVVGGRTTKGSAQGGSDASARLLSTLLTEMDGLECTTGVLVLAATNRPHILDAALMRPGRLDLQLHVPAPNVDGRHAILQVHTRGMPLAPDVDLKALAERTENFTGADLASLCQEAALIALRRDMQTATHMNRIHFESALSAFGDKSPSIDKPAFSG